MPMNSFFDGSTLVDSRYSSAASFIRAITLSMFLACVWQPGSSRIDAMYRPFSSRSRTTLYFMFAAPVFVVGWERLPVLIAVQLYMISLRIIV